jgi:hypothetical protein
MSDRHHSVGLKGTAPALLLCGLTSAYIAAYFCTVEVCAGRINGRNYYNVPEYHLRGVDGTQFFYPMHFIDRNFIRPGLWEGTFYRCWEGTFYR